MPSKIQLDENLWFLYTCIQKSDMKIIDFGAVAELANIKPPAARMRYTRLKRQIEDGTLTGQHGNTHVPSNATASHSKPSISMHPNRVPSTFMPPTHSFEYPPEAYQSPYSSMKTKSKKRKIEFSDGNRNSISYSSKAPGIRKCKSEDAKTIRNDNTISPSGEPLEPGEIQEPTSDSDDLENIPLSKIRRSTQNQNQTPNSATTPPPSLSKPINSPQTSPRPSTSPNPHSHSQPSPHTTNTPPPPFQSATLPYPPPKPPLSSPAIYHGFRGAKRGYRYFQGGDRGMKYVSPYGPGVGGGNGGGREEGVRRVGGVGEPFRSAGPVDSIHGREFGRPYARGAWGVEVRDGWR
ncbi:hypothetical protein HYALB_00002647 [Hymenoscyphus albidus]|uniref:Myb-like DNA-binding domain-containing protein n=1 Tax=Hymenoscyphus albidus TaxID=595503 RepID=A0A9N9Q9B2_9HELO|nr:hypothetical protein HYALB_00002647 [Hymenoscyphus albidus]